MRSEHLTATAAEFKTQLQQVADPDCLAYLNKNLKFLKKQIDEISVQIENLIKQNEGFNHSAKIIASIPGVGNGTTAIFLAMIPELGKVSNKVAAALVGVAPYIKQSGSYKGQARISGGRSSVRSCIYMAALSAIRHNPVLVKFYNRLIAVGKAFKIAIVAVMRKLVTYINTLVRKGELWNPA